MSVSHRVKQKLGELPDKPGVYLMRDRSGRIVYIGKAASLRSRVRQYFQRGTLRGADPRIRGLINSIEDFEFIVTRSEADAILTEGQLIKEYRPRYNAYFKDDKRFLLLRVHLDDPFPRFELCRIEKNDGAAYFGPYSRSMAARAALEFVEKKFGIRHCAPRVPGESDYRHCHNDIIRFCSAPCIGRASPADYRARVEEACAFLRGERPGILKDLETAMAAEAAALNFEKAAALRDTLLMLRKVIRQRFRHRSLEVRAEDAARGVADLQTALSLPSPPRVIECFDISNISGTHAVASMVCSVEGMPQRSRYRLFRIRTVEGSDDPGMMAEVVKRRYARLVHERQALPDLVLVDGGITQLRAARAELDALGLAALPCAGLAKQYEEVYRSADTAEPPLRLPRDSRALKVLQHIRDEAHRFALTFHRGLRTKRIRESLLDEVPGIGGKRKQLLLAHFGSLRRLARASADEIAAVPGIGPVMARALHGVLHRPPTPVVPSEEGIPSGSRKP
jgi:excinuclease ABC subunit C